MIRFPTPAPEPIIHLLIEYTPKLQELFLGLYGLILTNRSAVAEWKYAPRELNRLAEALERKHDELTNYLVKLLEERPPGQTD